MNRARKPGSDGRPWSDPAADPFADFVDSLGDGPHPETDATAPLSVPDRPDQGREALAAVDAVEESTRRVFMDADERRGALWALGCMRERLAALPSDTGERPTPDAGDEPLDLAAIVRGTPWQRRAIASAVVLAKVRGLCDEYIRHDKQDLRNAGINGLYAIRAALDAGPRTDPGDTPFAGRLAQQMRRSGTTQKDLADRIGMTQTAVSYWVNGKRTPDVTTTGRVAAALDCDPGWLAFGTEN